MLLDPVTLNLSLQWDCKTNSFLILVLTSSFEISNKKLQKTYRIWSRLQIITHFAQSVLQFLAIFERDFVVVLQKIDPLYI